MRIAIRYQSRGGNTKKVADLLAEKLNIKAETVEVPITDPVDLLIIGSGVYASQISPKLSKYMKELDKNLVKEVAPFCTGQATSNITSFSKIAKQEGLCLSKYSLPIRFSNMTYFQGLQKGKGEITDDIEKQIDEFAKNILED